MTATTAMRSAPLSAFTKTWYTGTALLCVGILGYLLATVPAHPENHHPAPASPHSYEICLQMHAGAGGAGQPRLWVDMGANNAALHRHGPVPMDLAANSQRRSLHSGANGVVTLRAYPVTADNLRNTRATRADAASEVLQVRLPGARGGRACVALSIEAGRAVAKRVECAG